MSRWIWWVEGREYGGGQWVWCDAIFCFSFNNEEKLLALCRSCLRALSLFVLHVSLFLLTMALVCDWYFLTSRASRVPDKTLGSSKKRARARSWTWFYTCWAEPSSIIETRHELEPSSSSWKFWTSRAWATTTRPSSARIHALCLPFDTHTFKYNTNSICTHTYYMRINI